MRTIYISDSGDDKNDGLSLKTAIYSLKRAKELDGGRNDSSWHFGPRAWKRIQMELADEGERAPSIMDTPANRAAMPQADYKAWPKVEEVAATILFHASPENKVTRGAVVPVYGQS